MILSLEGSNPAATGIGKNGGKTTDIYIYLWARHNQKHSQKVEIAKFDAERGANFRSPPKKKKISLEKNYPNPKIQDNPHGHQ
jgi:hypothetical protein